MSIFRTGCVISILGASIAAAAVVATAQTAAPRPGAIPPPAGFAPAPPVGGQQATTSPAALRAAAWREKWVKAYWAKEEERERRVHAEAASAQNTAKSPPAPAASVRAAAPPSTAQVGVAPFNIAPQQAAAPVTGSPRQSQPIAAQSVHVPPTAGRPAAQSVLPPATGLTGKPSSAPGSAVGSVGGTAASQGAVPPGAQTPPTSAQASPTSAPLSPVAAASQSVPATPGAALPPAGRPAVAPVTEAASGIPADSGSVGRASGTKAAPAKPAGSDLALTQAKPDIVPPAPESKDHTIDSPIAAVGDGWKMLVYLVPTVVFILVCLQLLKRYQQKTGKLPAALGPAAARDKSIPTLAGTLSSMFRSGASVKSSGSGIRLVESMSVGGAALHLVQVRGRTLLLSAGATGVTVLTEFADGSGAESEEFRQMLQAAAADMDGLDMEDGRMPVSAVVGSLEDALRGTGGSLERRLRRLRTVSEAEGASYRGQGSGR